MKQTNRLTVLGKKRLTVLSFNILAQTWIDNTIKKHAQSKTHLTKEYRIRKQIQILKDVNADIVFLQEVTPSVLNKFLTALPIYATSHCFASIYWQPARNSDPINGNVIIWKRGLFVNPKCKVVELDSKRGIYAATLHTTLVGTHTPILLVNVHFDYSLDTYLQTRQFRNLFKKGKKRYITNQKHVIIAGDFNMGGNDISAFPILPDIKKHGFVDFSLGMRTHPFPAPDAANVTHILARGFKQISKTKVMKSPSIGDTLRNVGSDHFPVHVKVQLCD